MEREAKLCVVGSVRIPPGFFFPGEKSKGYVGNTSGVLSPLPE